MQLTREEWDYTVREEYKHPVKIERLWRLQYKSNDTFLGRGTGVGFLIHRGLPAFFGAITAAVLMASRCIT